MSEPKKIRELIIPITDYPHMPYWATLEEAIVQLNLAHETGHDTILVFDEFYRLMGLLHQRDILRGIRPEFVELCPPDVQIQWQDLMTSASPKQLTNPTKDFMSPFEIIIDIEDHILKVAHLMLHHNIGVLPVKESEKVVGVLRMHDIFHEIAEFVLKSRG